jgi:predicted AlkP superfamily phosphohydrolase/phosphomutase
MLRRSLMVALAAAALLPATAAPQAKPKVVILGFDGADARLVERWMDEGKLPNLAKLRDDGGYAPLQPTNPPQTPVSWSSFATGTNPGKTRIFDFLMRNPADYLPDFAMNSEAKRTFLFGERNGLVVGMIAGAAVFTIVLLLLLLVRFSWATRLGIATILGVAAGLPAGFVAKTYLPADVPTAVNHRRGETMWELAARAGLKAQVIRVPATFPAEDMGDGHMLSGLGVPDMRGRVGTPTFYSSDPDFKPGGNGANEFSLEFIRLEAGRGTIATRVVGPNNKPFYDYVVDRKSAGIADSKERADAKRRARQELDDADVPRRIDLPMTLKATDDALTVTVSGQSQTLKVGAWSDWFVLDFPVNWLVDRAAPLRGIARFKLLALAPHLELYLSPVNFHPDCHPVAFSWPPDYSQALRKRFGLFKTIGWPEDTWSLPSGVGDENLFLEDMTFTLDKDEEILQGLLGDRTDDLYIQIFYFTDRIGHLFWRFLDPDHPAYKPELAAKYAPEVLKAYQRMDDIVGKARALAGPDAVFMVCSDHGFSSFRRGVNINTWLVRNGLMTLKGQTDDAATLEKLFDTRDLFQNVDWSRTKAYALGLGSIYVNLVGREKQGIVIPGAEYDEVRRKIKEGLEALTDPKTGEHPVSKVWTREETYTGFDPDLIPDLRAGNALNYRVSWQTSLGGVPPDILEDNLKAWSGDHCSNDPSLVRGILFVNRKIAKSDPAMIDVAPTVLHALGLASPAAMDGKPLF